MQTTSPVSLGRAGNNQHDTFLPKARRLVWILFILAIANGGSLYLQLKINLRDIRPMIWRRVVVAEDTTLTRLHTVVQTAMGWEGYHLYDFAVRGQTFGRGGASHSGNITLADCNVQKGESLLYIYDFGDDWVHDVKVEKLLEPKAKTFYPVCVDGKRACPPEDSGSPWGYRDLLKVLKNKRHPDYRELRRWVGRSFDPEAFDVGDVNTRLKVLGASKG